MKWFKKNQTQAESPASEKKGVWSRLQEGLGNKLGRLLLGKKEVDAELLEELESLLITSDLGIKTTQKILAQLTERLERKQLADGEAVFSTLEELMGRLLAEHASPFTLNTSNHKPFVMLMVGVNGAGKTTTMGKLAKLYQGMGKKVMLAAGDTFRAAAVEQLQAWGERSQIPVVAQHTGADSASVVFDAFQAAKARGIDILIADTAGRLHTQGNLMDELKKVKRVLQKIDAEAPHEVMLVLDASIGQNALNQARQFHEAVGVTGVTITKLDGTAKGGILFAIADELGLPFRYVGLGEGMDDLRAFDPQQFVQAIFENDPVQAS